MKIKAKVYLDDYKKTKRDKDKCLEKLTKVLILHLLS